MGHKILGGTQADWAISLVDGYYKMSDILKRFLNDEMRDKFVILWAWQTEKGTENIENSVKGDEIFFMTDKSKAQIIGCGKWLKRLPHEDLSNYWKNQPQWKKKWEYPQLLEVVQLDERLLNVIKGLSQEEREAIIKNKVIDKKRLFSALNLTTIPNPHGGSLWETHNTEQNSKIEHAKTSFINPFAPVEAGHPSFWWVSQGATYTTDRGKQ